MQLNGLALTTALRIVLAALLAQASARGWITSDQTLNTILLDVGTIGILAWSVWEGINQARDVWSNAVALARDTVVVALNWAVGMGYIGKGDVAELEGAIGTIALYLWSVESKHLNLQLKKVLPWVLPVMLAIGLYGCGTLGGGGGQGTTLVGEALAVSSGFQESYISVCITAVPRPSFCTADRAARAKVASQAFTDAAGQAVSLVENGADVTTVLITLATDAAELQAIINELRSSSRSAARSTAMLDPVTVVTIAQIALQVLPQVEALFQELSSGSGPSLDAVLKTIQAQNATIQAS